RLRRPEPGRPARPRNADDTRRRRGLVVHIERRAALTEADRALGGAVDPRAGAVLLGEYTTRWIQSRELAPRTRELYRHLYDRLIAPTFGRTSLTRITTEAVRRWNSDLSRRAGALQAAKAYRLLRAVLNT